MSLLFNKSDKEILLIRNKIFSEVGIPALEKNGFIKSPFLGSWFGKDNLGGYCYEFCKLINNSQLEKITVNIINRDKWIQISLNIFKLKPEVSSLDKLKRVDGIRFKLPPNSLTDMRLRSDDYKGFPLFYILFCPEHKIGNYYSEKGFNSEVKKLTCLIERDMINIDSFVKKWYEMHEVNQTDWEGNSTMV